jgi:hypothetical protein
VPQPLRKIYPALDLPKAQDQVRVALRRAVSECGGVKEFARKLNVELARLGRKTVRYQTVQWWLSEGTFVHEDFWQPIEVVTDYSVTRRDLRPDRYLDG